MLIFQVLGNFNYFYIQNWVKGGYFKRHRGPDSVQISIVND